MKQRMQPVRKEDGERMAKDLGAVKYVECSALTQYKLKDVFDEVCNSFDWDVNLRIMQASASTSPTFLPFDMILIASSLFDPC